MQQWFAIVLYITGVLTGLWAGIGIGYHMKRVKR